MKPKYYSLKDILSKNATYNIIIGERSNGKTYAALKYAIEQHAKNGSQTAIIRRWSDDFKGKRGSTMFDAIVASGDLESLTGGRWTNIIYRSARWYLCNHLDDDNIIVDDTPLAYAFAISTMEHDKSTSYPKVTTIIFDEFISRTSYLPDEFVLYMNCLSTIIRQRDNVKIFMLGNTVNRYCPYYDEMGLSHIKTQKQGTIDLYKYGTSDLVVAVEYCAPLDKRIKKSDKYFAFDNPRLQMITGGQWEIDIYPHCPCKYRPVDVAYKYYIIYSGDILECEIVCLPDQTFTFIHPFTGRFNPDPNTLIYSAEFSALPNYRRMITRPMSNLENKIAEYYKKDKVFYSSNEVGEIVRNYLIFCGKMQK